MKTSIDTSTLLRPCVTFAIWALAAGVVTYGAIRWQGMSSGLPPDTVTVGLEPPALAAPDAGSWVHLLGTAAPPQAPAASLRLIGIAADRARAQWGFALISESGKPAKSYRVGDSLPDGQRLVGLEANAALLETPSSGSKATLPLVRKDAQHSSPQGDAGHARDDRFSLLARP